MLSSQSVKGQEDNRIEGLEQRIDSLLTHYHNPKDQLELIKLIRWPSSIFTNFVSIPPVKPPGYALRVTSLFGYRVHPVFQNKHVHSGIDLPPMNGNDTIYAPANGRVDTIDYNDRLGFYLVLSHKYGYETVFGHLSTVLARPYQEVKQGQIIAIMGKTGVSTGKHLHYTIKHNGKFVDPLNYCYLYFDYLLR